ncbi:FHA domain-containing protein [Candidatus Calescamantes bacterium]|nr:FHA domain-containing protein [Candidatus Calescamantes bacterium]
MELIKKFFRKQKRAFLVDKDNQYYALNIPFATKVGRSSECDIKITGDLHVSRHHALIIFEEEENKFYIKDMGSKHGTFVNGRKLEEGELKELKDGDHIRLGKSITFTFKIL